MRHPVRLRNSGTRWAVASIPPFIAAFLGLATYVVAARLCVDYLHREEGESGLAAALLTLYFVFLILTIATYLRTFITVQFDPALVPLPPGREEEEEKASKEKSRRKGRGRGGLHRYDDPEANPWTPPDPNPDSPGLEAFYSKSVFVCEADGRPKWCSECRSWKPDRTHHSSELGRCVRKLDHVCPWVGGMVSETSFNWFVQFTFYTAMLCAVSLGTAGTCLQRQQRQGRPLDGFIIALIAVAGFFGFFTFAMTVTSGRFVLTNTTNIDLLRKAQVHQLAIRIPRGSAPSQRYQTITYPLASFPGWVPGGVYPSQRAAAAAAPTSDTNNTNNTNGAATSPSEARDRQATRTFAIVKTDAGENPWDLGYWRNFKSVMGGNVVEWLLPVRHSPCCDHESMVSDYELGPLLAELRKRHGIPDEDEDVNGIELR